MFSHSVIQLFFISLKSECFSFTLLLEVAKSLFPFNIPLGCFQILAPFYKRSLEKLFVSLYIMHPEVTELTPALVIRFQDPCLFTGLYGSSRQWVSWAHCSTIFLSCLAAHTRELFSPCFPCSYEHTHSWLSSFSLPAFSSSPTVNNAVQYIGPDLHCLLDYKITMATAKMRGHIFLYKPGRSLWEAVLSAAEVEKGSGNQDTEKSNPGPTVNQQDNLRKLRLPPGCPFLSLQIGWLS